VGPFPLHELQRHDARRVAWASLLVALAIRKDPAAQALAVRSATRGAWPVRPAWNLRSGHGMSGRDAMQPGSTQLNAKIVKGGPPCASLH
jgi:hypothetical protein